MQSSVCEVPVGPTAEKEIYGSPAAVTRGAGLPEPLWVEISVTGLPLAPNLEINPIGTAYRPASPFLSLAVTSMVWGLLAGAGILAFRLHSTSQTRAFTTESVSFVLNDTDKISVEGGGHQGGGLPPPRALELNTPAPPPPPTQDLPANAPVPSSLPTEPVQAAPAQAVMGVVGGTGTGNGYGTGSGSGTGTGSGTGSGSGAGPGIQPKNDEPIVVPYSKIVLLKVINPEYPERARRAGIEGNVVVRVTIDEYGVPTAFHVVEGEPILVKETLKVLPHWRFTPVYHMGRRVRATFDAVLRFNLA